MVMTGTPGDDRAALLNDIELSRKIQTFGVWCGPAFTLFLFGGWGLIGGFIPMIPPSDNAVDVAAVYADNPNLHRIGLVLGMIGLFLTVPFFLTISMQIRRVERRVPILAIMQFAFGLLVTVVLAVPMLLFVGTSFRPERTAELTQLMNDFSYVLLILPWPPILGQLAPIAIAAFIDRRAIPVFPRWVGYYSIWVAILLLPATMVVFFKSGPFAWNGVVGFWIPAAVFGTWYYVMAVLLQRGVRNEAEEDRIALQPASR